MFNSVLITLPVAMADNLDSFVVGQRVIWHYQAHGAMSPVQSIGAEIIKLGSKRVQIEIKKNNGEIVKRWVNCNKLEKAQNQRGQSDTKLNL